MSKLDKSKMPQYHNTGNSVVFINPPKECVDETKKLGTTTQIEGATFAVNGANIVVSHGTPEVLTAF